MACFLPNLSLKDHADDARRSTAGPPGRTGREEPPRAAGSWWPAGSSERAAATAAPHRSTRPAATERVAPVPRGGSPPSGTPGGPRRHRPRRRVRTGRGGRSGPVRRPVRARPYQGRRAPQRHVPADLRRVGTGREDREGRRRPRAGPRHDGHRDRGRAEGLAEMAGAGRHGERGLPHPKSRYGARASWTSSPSAPAGIPQGVRADARAVPGDVARPEEARPARRPAGAVRDVPCTGSPLRRGSSGSAGVTRCSRP